MSPEELVQRLDARVHSHAHVTIVVPALNEADGIGRVIDSARRALTNYDYEILVVDGGSTDGTDRLAARLGAKVIYQKNVGYGDALITGFSYAVDQLDSEVVAMIDADTTYDPEQLIALLKEIEDGRADFVIGNRFPNLQKGAMTLTNKIGNKILSWITSALLKVKVSDTQCGMRAFRADLVHRMDLKNTGMPFATEMLIEARHAGAEISEIPITYKPRIGKSKLNPIPSGFKILAIIVRLTRDYEPLLFFGTLGVGLATLGVLFGIGVVVEWLRTGVVTRLAAVVLSSLLLISGFQLISIGMLADMVKDVRREIRKSTVMR